MIETFIGTLTSLLVSVVLTLYLEGLEDLEGRLHQFLCFMSGTPIACHGRNLKNSKYDDYFYP